MKAIRNNRGSTLISVLAGLSLGAMLVMHSFQSQSHAVKFVQHHNSTAIAQLYSVELLEFFRGFGSGELKAYLSTNPINESTDSQALYKLCSHVNLQDRINSTDTNRILLNADPVAELPATKLDGLTEKTRANRFYVVRIVDATTLAVNKFACNLPAKDYTLAKTERYLVSVGVSWVPKRGAASNARKEILSSLIP